MKFTTSCFIRKNTPEIRRQLRELGYDACECCVRNDFEWIKVSLGEVRCVSAPKDSEKETPFACWDAIDCGTNEALFLGLAALRDDSDYMQWFIYTTDGGEKWKLYKHDDFCILGFAKKATPCEIAEHFAKNDQ